MLYRILLYAAVSVFDVGCLKVMIFTQRRSVAKNVGCFCQNLFVCLWVCLWVCLFACQHDNFRTSKHKMMKLVGRYIVQKSQPSSNLGVIAPTGGEQLPKMWHFAEP